MTIGFIQSAFSWLSAQFQSFLAWLLGFVPSGHLPDWVLSVLNDILSEIKVWDSLIPISELFLLLQITFYIQVALFSFWIGQWILRKIRGG